MVFKARLQHLSTRLHLPVIGRLIGLVCSLVCIGIFLHTPSWPTPDKLLVFLTFVFMTFGQALVLLLRLGPFVVLLLAYESFRGLAHHLNTHVHYLWMPWVDRKIFGQLPTTWLQSHWWHGSVQWFDFVFYIFYMLHFILPIGLALLVWKLRETYYWQLVTSYILLSFTGFLTFLLFPAAPPWMAAQQGLIEPITRISSNVWYALGIHDFPSLYNRIAPNPVAAVPSLHAGYATLFVLLTYRLFGKKWALLACIYPVMIYLGTVYQGEHYAIDEILGLLYALVVFFSVDAFFKHRRKRLVKIDHKTTSAVPRASLSK